MKEKTDMYGNPERYKDYTKMGTRARRIFKSGGEVELKAGYLYVENLKARDGRSGGWGLLKWDGESGKVYGNDIQAMKE